MKFLDLQEQISVKWRGSPERGVMLLCSVALSQALNVHSAEPLS